ncbi:F0F1 ATP synthase subunit epsilon [Balneolaceae bacterium YR4-1]|uniref:F0F1 ATP synthase subunit epsilon n=1 Tax=Halalkalibaculum roseum TaxID=2709311 RepID=A0A6M1T8H1_9BACT|nr:F0F1 ATP synthase subunit epsilon [Halalkalibaculum roseum]NGP76573.1 F0F1 ATP synthase subunit epsilon [Halalkalibaculum roseum]
MIHLKIMTPEQIIADRQVDKIIADGQNGFFCLKPRHVDFTSALRAGIFYYYIGEEEFFTAIDSGILVKCGKEVLVSALNAISGKDLKELEELVKQKFVEVEETEQASVMALRNLEAELVQHFVDLEKNRERHY